MRTTVTLDPDVEALLRQRMRKRHLSFKAALNQAIRDGLSMRAPKGNRHFTLRTYRMGHRPEIALDKALGLASTLEDEELIRKLNVRK
ncbi:MAG TPA: antitoxin [Planctomycetota bacterium]|nr:antitoxin [Planctomycetota bacterium]